MDSGSQRSIWLLCISDLIEAQTLTFLLSLKIATGCALAMTSGEIAALSRQGGIARNDKVREFNPLVSMNTLYPL
jgi:hypothetical protein